MNRPGDVTPMDEVPVFGARVDGYPCQRRPSAYALIHDSARRLAVVRTPEGCFLPGGGIEPGESAEQAVVREALEEAGLILELQATLGRAMEIVHSPSHSVCFEKDSVFLEAAVTGRAPSHEQDHELLWLTHEQALSRLSHGSHRWAVSRVRSVGPREDSSTRSWERIADDWVAHADTNDYRLLFLQPRTLRLLGDVTGRRVLDLGCGEGGYSRELARLGARVTGVDGSARLIEVARQRALAERVEVDYRCLNASCLASVATSSFDLVLAAMSLMDVEDYEAAVGEAHRVLIDGGELLMSITHPCFSGPIARWVRDESGRPLLFAVDRYLDRGAWESYMTPSFRDPYLRRHRPLEDYLAAPLRAGLTLTEFLEPTATEDERRLSPRFEKMTRIPYFLFMRWRKEPRR